MKKTFKVIVDTVDGDTLLELTGEQLATLHDTLTTIYNKHYDEIEHNDEETNK